jgi:hypothetical protein
MYKIIGDKVREFDTMAGAYLHLVQLRENYGTLVGVKVFYNGKKLTRENLGEMAIYFMNNPEKLKAVQNA